MASPSMLWISTTQSRSLEVIEPLSPIPTGGYRGTLPLYATRETVTGTELLPGLLRCHIFAISARAAAYSRRDGPCIHKRHATFWALSPRVGPHQGRLEPFE